MSSPLTDSEASLLRHDGEFLMKNFIPLTVATIAWTAYLIITFQATFILCKNGIWDSRPRKVLLVTTVIMFLLSTTQLLSFFGEFLIQVKSIMLESAPTLKERVDNSLALHGQFSLTSTIILQLQAILGDGIVIWRTWAIWGKRNKFIIVPSVLWVLSCIALIATTILQPHVTATVRIMIATQATSAATNTVATGLIAYKAWRHRQLLKSAFGRSALASTQISRILSLLVESGCIYLLIWLVDIIISVVAITTYGPQVIAANAIDYVITQALGIYPTIIIILVEKQKTVWDNPALLRVISVLKFSPESGSQAESDNQTQLVSQSNLNGVFGIEGKGPLRNGEKGTEEVV